jgi:hypothetical protein
MRNKPQPRRTTTAVSPNFAIPGLLRLIGDKTIEGANRCGFSSPRNRFENRNFISATKQGQMLFKENGDGHDLEYWLCRRSGDHLVSGSMAEREKRRRV